MLVMFQIVALCLAADAVPSYRAHVRELAVEGPSYTVHVRELTTSEKVIRMPLTGSVAIVDAVEALKWSPRNLARMDLWIVRREKGGEVKVLQVDWAAISQRGESATNYQILAGDRLFLQARPAK
jgi:hypothetical protein